WPVCLPVGSRWPWACWCTKDPCSPRSGTLCGSCETTNTEPHCRNSNEMWLPELRIQLRWSPNANHERLALNRVVRGQAFCYSEPTLYRNRGEHHGKAHLFNDCVTGRLCGRCRWELCVVGTTH